MGPKCGQGEQSSSVPALLLAGLGWSAGGSTGNNRGAWGRGIDLGCSGSLFSELMEEMTEKNCAQLLNCFTASHGREGEEGGEGEEGEEGEEGLTQGPG